MMMRSALNHALWIGYGVMAETNYTKLEIALQFLDTAMRLYIEEQDYFSVIHLAGAAEELLGKHLPENDRICTLAWKAQVALAIEYTGSILTRDEIHNSTSKAGKEFKKKAVEVVCGPKNSIKHYDGSSDSDVRIDVVAMAEIYLEHALINFDTLRNQEGFQSRLPKSSVMWKFEEFQATKMSEILGS
jgi:hypothetical protein